MRTLAAPIVPDFRTVVLDHDRGVLMEAYHPASREFMGSIRFLNEGLVAKVVDLSVAHQWRQRGVHDKLIAHLRWRGFKVIEQYSDVGEEWAKTAGFRDATDVPSTLYHGTWRDLAPGTELRAGVVPSNWGERPGLAAQVVWMTDDIDDARSWAIQGAKEMGQPIDQVFVYEVRPVGPLLEWDPPNHLARMGIRHFTAESAMVASTVKTAISDDDPIWADLAEALSGPSKRPYEPILPPAHELYGGFIQEGSDGRLWLDGEPVRKLYRVVDPKEWEAAQANGYLQSTGPTAGGGYTRASAKPDDRWRNQLGGGTAVLEIDYDPADGWHASAEGYAATRSRIPLSRVRKIGMVSSARVASIAEARERLPEAFLREPHEVLYPPIWDGLKMRPEARTAILNHAYAAFGALPYEGKLHFAVIGSGASYNWDEAGDLDVQVWCSDPALVGPLRRAIIPVNNPTTGELGLGGEMAVQYYVKPGEGSPEENLAGQPYACFDIDTETWLKKPIPLTPEFYAEAIASILGRARGVASEVEGLLAAYDRAEREVAYWSLFPEHQARQGEAEAVVREIHADIVALFRSIFDARKDAYAPGGRGIEDERDAMVKALEVWGLWERLKKLGQAKVGDLLKTAVSESDRQAFYEWQMALRAGGGPIPLEAAQNFLRRILINEGFPRGDEAYVQRGSQPNVAMIGWDWEVSPPIPFIHAGPGTPDIITVIHEAAHIIVNRGREPIGGWEGAHDDEWLDTYLRLLDKWAGAGKANFMRRGRDQGWRAAS